MKIASSFVVRAPREEVWRFINDPARMLPCVPGCEAIEPLGARSYRATVKIELGPIKSRFNLDIAVEREEQPLFVETTTSGEEGTRASTLTAKSRLDLAAVDLATTEVSYSSDVAVVGRLGRFGLGMMKKKAESLARQFERTFSDRVEATSPSETA